MSDVTFGPFRIGYQDTGPGPSPVVALHSGGFSARQWKRLSDRLAPAHRVLLPDFLGYGASGAWPTDTPFHVALDVLGVEAVLRAVGEPVHLVAHSYGGLVALLAALHNPDRVRSLALYEPVAFGVLHSAGEDAALANLRAVQPAATLAAAGGAEAWLRSFVDWWNGPGAWDALGEPVRASFRAVVHKLFDEVRTLLEDRTPHTAYGVLTRHPTLLLTGEQSPLAARRVIDVLSRAIPGAAVQVIAGAGHMAPLTRHDEVNALIATHVHAAR